MAKKFEDLHRLVVFEDKIEEYSMSNVSDLINKLKQFQDRVPAHAVKPRVTFVLSYNSGYYDSIEPYIQLDGQYYEAYTKKEIEEFEAEKKAKAAANKAYLARRKQEEEQKELLMYEELKKKFEGK